MVILTFDDAVNNENWDIYEKIFMSNRTNPNGCPIATTFYLSHEYTNYRHVQKLWNNGHEIGIHSITYVILAIYSLFYLMLVIFKTVIVHLSCGGPLTPQWKIGLMNLLAWPTLLIVLPAFR